MLSIIKRQKIPRGTHPYILLELTFLCYEKRDETHDETLDQPHQRIVDDFDNYGINYYLITTVVCWKCYLDI